MFLYVYEKYGNNRLTRSGKKYRFGPLVEKYAFNVILNLHTYIHTYIHTYVYWTPLRGFQANLHWSLYTYIYMYI